MFYVLVFCTTASKWHWLKTFLAKTAVNLTVTPRSHHRHISFSIIDRGVLYAGCLPDAGLRMDQLFAL